MFKRRSSKDLSVRVGYEHLNSKPTKKLDQPRSTMSASAVAPVANVSTPSFHQNLASSSSSLKTTATTSPQADGEVPTTAGASPMTSLKGIIPPAAPAIASTGSAGGGFPNGDGIKASTRGSSASNGAIAPPKGNAKSSTHSKAPMEPPSKLLMIGEGVLFEGATEGCVAAVVAGRLKGKIKSRRLEVTRAGKVDGTAVCEMAEIAGMFEGDLTATKALKICSTGKFRGDVSFGSIVVENGGKLEGRVNFGGLRATVPESSSRSRLDPASAPVRKEEVVVTASDSSTALHPPTTPPPSRKSTADPPPRPSTSATIADERAQEETSPAQEGTSPAQDETSPAEAEPSPADEEPSPAQEEPSAADEEPSRSQEEPSPLQEPSPSQKEPSPSHEEPSSSQKEPSPSQEEPSPTQEETSPVHEEPSPVQKISPEPEAAPAVVLTSLEVEEEPITSETSLSEPLQSLE